MEAIINADRSAANEHFDAVIPSNLNLILQPHIPPNPCQIA